MELEGALHPSLEGALHPSLNGPLWPGQRVFFHYNHWQGTSGMSASYCASHSGASGRSSRRTMPSTVRMSTSSCGARLALGKRLALWLAGCCTVLLMTSSTCQRRSCATSSCSGSLRHCDSGGRLECKGSHQAFVLLLRPRGSWTFSCLFYPVLSSPDSRGRTARGPDAEFWSPGPLRPPNSPRPLLRERRLLLSRRRATPPAWL